MAGNDFDGVNELYGKKDSDDFDEEFFDDDTQEGDGGRMGLGERWEAVKEWASDNPMQAIIAGGVAAAVAVSAIVVPIALHGGDDDEGTMANVSVQRNPSDDALDDFEVQVPTTDAPEPDSGDSVGSKPAPPKPPQDKPKTEAKPKPKKAKPLPMRKRDSVTAKEKRAVKKMNIPDPPKHRVQRRPNAAQHELPRAIPGEGAEKAPAQAVAKRPKNAMEIRGQRFPVLPMSVEEGTSRFLPPENVGQVGWYQDSAEPGTDQEGSVLMSSHINSGEQGNGVGSIFADLKEGEVITIWGPSGQLTKWKITKSYPIRKVGEMAEAVNRTTGPQGLVLVTCGGEYIGPPLYYQDNIITEAVPVKM